MFFTGLACFLFVYSLCFQWFFELKRNYLSLRTKICNAYARILMRSLCVIFTLIGFAIGAYTCITLIIGLMFDLLFLILDVLDVKELTDKK